ncbi:N-acetyltransferase [Streptomyces sp. NBRC 109706]|uniref:GNAT family N-acetyltransferase n=1 Tax=Streptomyces sp. NBRC 109706 TaxID=1550035 RepID=UPI000780F9FE|nr:GNAT family N-acetyltransferase [Streptomyces sp. NBRC 109706]
MANLRLLTAEDIELMQGLARRVTAVRPDLVNADASVGELAWNWGRGRATRGAGWTCQLWFDGSELVAWGWFRPQRDGACLGYQVHPDHAGLVDEVIDWYDRTAGNVERTVVPCASDRFGLERWAAHGYREDEGSLGDAGDWTQMNERDLDELEEPALPDGFRFRDADEVGPEAVVRAHVDAWARSTYTLEDYLGVRASAPYRGDLHLLVEAPDGTMAASAIMWFDEANSTVEFEPLGTHVDYRRRGLARAMMLHGMRRARAAGAIHATVACLGAPGHPAARELYYGVGFRPFVRDAPLVKAAEAASPA